MTNLIKNKYIQEEEQNRRTILQGKVVGYGEIINESETVNVQLLTGNPDSQEQLSTDVLRNVPVELSDSSIIKTALKEGDIVSVGFFEEDYSSPHVINSFGTTSTIATNEIPSDTDQQEIDFGDGLEKDSEDTGDHEQQKQSFQSSKEALELVSKMNIVDLKFKFTEPLENRISTTAIVLHHSAQTPMTPQEVHKLHQKQNGWAGIGYHYYITKDGTIYIGRPIDKKGAHTKQHNDYTIGISFEGNYQSVDKSMGTKQLEQGKALIQYLKQVYGKLNVYRHKDLLTTGQNLNDIAKPSSLLYDPIKRKKWLKENGFSEETACPGDNFPFSSFADIMK